MGVLDMSTLDTEPGATGPHSAFAPPSGFEGTEDDYRAWLRQQWESNRAIQQRMVVAARSKRIGAPRTYVGPYADVLASVLRRV